MNPRIEPSRTSITPNQGNPHVIVFGERASLMDAAAERIAGIAERAIADRGWFNWVLSGGTTPRPVYRLLASPRFAKRIDWQHVHFFWSDERCVPPNSPESNYRMACETLLDAIAPPGENVHRMHGEEEPSRAAASYEQVLREYLGARSEAIPRSLDLVLLGMGADGHTASLFPGSPAASERTRWVMANRAAENSSWRLTLTPVILNAAEQIVFLVTGASKADRLAQVLQGSSPSTEAEPVRLICPTRGELVWLVDADAAARLERSSYQLAGHEEAQP